MVDLVIFKLLTFFCNKEFCCVGKVFWITGPYCTPAVVFASFRPKQLSFSCPALLFFKEQMKGIDTIGGKFYEII